MSVTARKVVDLDEQLALAIEYPAGRAGTGCMQRSVHDENSERFNCTRPAGHEGIHVGHSRWADQRIPKEGNRAMAYWVRD